MRETYLEIRGAVRNLYTRLRRLFRRLPFSATVTEESSLRWLRAVMHASIAIPSIVLLAAAVQTYLDIDTDAQERLDRDARIVQEHALKILETAASVAGRIDDVIATDVAITARSNEQFLHQKLAEISVGMPQLLSVWLSDSDGTAIASDRYFPIPTTASVSQREYFQDQKRQNMPIALSAALRSPRGENFFVLSKRWQASDGRFLGVIGVALSEPYFIDFYRSISGPDKDLAVSLVRDDGATLVSFPSSSLRANKYSSGNAIMQSIRQGGVRDSEIHADLDGVARYVTVRKVGNYPVYVAVGALRSTAFARWRARMAAVLGFILPATIALVLLSWTAQRKVGREHAAIAQWQDEMSRRVAAEEALARAQKMDALGQMTGGVAHDFNNMLQIISSNVHILRFKLKHAEIDADVHNQLAAIDRARLSGESLTRQLLAFSRQQALRPESVDLGQRMPTLCGLIRHSLGQTVRLDCETEADTWAIQVDPSQLDMALLNLALNARDAMPDGGVISISARNVSPQERGQVGADLRGDFVAIAVSDTGQGVPDEIKERIFEPFFTTKDVGKGTGLGLSQVFGFATQSGGTVVLKSDPGEGTTLTIYLPRSHTQTARRTAQDALPEHAASGRLLIVEDNQEVGDGLAELLGEVGFSVTLARSAMQALEVLGLGQDFDLLLTDLVMPGNFNGVQLARAVMQSYPQLPVILMTGYSAEVRKASAEGFTILIKPFQMSALIEAIRERIDLAKTSNREAAHDL